MIRDLICGNNQSCLLNLNMTFETGTTSVFLILMQEKSTFFDWSNYSGTIDMKKEKSSFQMLGLSSSSELDWGSCTVFIANTTFKKICAFMCSIRFFLLRFLFISKDLSYSSQLLLGYVDMLNKLQRQVFGTVFPVLAASLEIMNLFIVEMQPAKYLSIGIIFIDVYQNWLNWFCFHILVRGLLFNLIDCMSFCYHLRISLSTVFFLAWVNSEIICLQNAFL